MSVGQQLACPSSGHSSVWPEPPFWKERGFPLDSGHTVGTGLSCTRRNAILDSRTWEDELLQGRSKGFHPGCFAQEADNFLSGPFTYLPVSA